MSHAYRVFLQTAAKHFSDTCMCSTDIDTFSSLPVCLQQRIHLHMLLKIASPSRACTSAAGLSWESGSTSYKTCCSPLSPTLFVHALKPWLTLLSCTALCPSPSFSSAQIPPIPQSQRPPFSGLTNFSLQALKIFMAWSMAFNYRMLCSVLFHIFLALLTCYKDFFCMPFCASIWKVLNTDD